MSASDSITKAKLFNPSSVTYRAPLVNKRGGKSVQCQLNGVAYCSTVSPNAYLGY